MKRERALKVVLVFVGLLYCFWGYLLFDNLRHARWLSGHCDVMPMFLSLNTALGVCLLLAVTQPAAMTTQPSGRAYSPSFLSSTS